MRAVATRWMGPHSRPLHSAHLHENKSALVASNYGDINNDIDSGMRAPLAPFLVQRRPRWPPAISPGLWRGGDVGGLNCN